MFDNIFNITFYKNSLFKYCVVLIGVSISFLVIYIISKIILYKFKKKVDKTTTLFDLIRKIIKHYLVPVLYFSAFLISIQYLDFNDQIKNIEKIISVIFYGFYCVRFVITIVTFLFNKKWLDNEEYTSQKSVFIGILSLAKLIIWGLASIIVLDNLGIKISALAAGLGIGGIAVALASQAILADFFSYITLFFDRPFEIGDFLIIGDMMGTVENIGFKTTRIRSLSGELLVFCNTDLTGSRLRNFKKMTSRRIVFKIGVEYSTPVELVKEIPQMIKSIVESLNEVTFDRSNFALFGDFSLIYETVYIISDPDYNKYMRIQEEINLKIMEEFEKKGINFAFPTQTIMLGKTETVQ